MLPVKKTSKCRTRTRRAHHALRAPNLVACPNFRVAKLPHAYCHNCGSVLIGRNWYELTDWSLDDSGRCSKCLAPCAGVFDAAPGTWGRKRQPVRLSA